MLINVDVKGLEVVVAAELSGDIVLRQEIIDKVDFHDANRVAFGLGEGKPGRLVAKVLKFRTIYGGTEYSFAKDPDFAKVSTSTKYWKEVLNQYFTKYYGLKKWHVDLVNEVKREGFITIPSGRYYAFQPKQGYGGWQWPETQIKNYPVQGFGADLVMLARIEAGRLIRESGLEALIVGTIHDSIVADAPSKNVAAVASMLKQAVESVPDLCRKHFNYDFSLPLTCEIQVGKNKLDMVEFI